MWKRIVSSRTEFIRPTSTPSERLSLGLPVSNPFGRCHKCSSLCSHESAASVSAAHRWVLLWRQEMNDTCGGTSASQDSGPKPFSRLESSHPSALRSPNMDSANTGSGISTFLVGGRSRCQRRRRSANAGSRGRSSSEYSVFTLETQMARYSQFFPAGVISDLRVLGGGDELSEQNCR